MIACTLAQDDVAKDLAFVEQKFDDLLVIGPDVRHVEFFFGRFLLEQPLAYEVDFRRAQYVRDETEAELVHVFSREIEIRGRRRLPYRYVHVVCSPRDKTTCVRCSTSTRARDLAIATQARLGVTQVPSTGVLRDVRLRQRQTSTCSSQGMQRGVFAVTIGTLARTREVASSSATRSRRRARSVAASMTSSRSA